MLAQDLRVMEPSGNHALLFHYKVIDIHVLAHNLQFMASFKGF